MSIPRNNGNSLGDRGRELLKGIDRLGGLDSLIQSGDFPLYENKNSAAEIPIGKVIPASEQPRQYFDESALDELAASIKAQGIIQPIIARPLPDGNYEIIAGERRWRAAKKVGLTVVPVIIRETNDDDAMVIALIENLQREDLNPLEEARAIAALRDKLSLSQEELSSRIGKSRSTIANALRLLQLPEIILTALQTGRISAGHARALLPLSDEQMRITLFNVIELRSLSVRDVENAVAHVKEYGELPSSVLNNTKRTHAPRAEKLPEIREAQYKLRRSVHPKVNISGDKQTGRITIPYDSQEEFERILNILG